MKPCSQEQLRSLVLISKIKQVISGKFLLSSLSYGAIFILWTSAVVADGEAVTTGAAVAPEVVAEEPVVAPEKISILDEPPPYDFDPYRVMIWLVSDSPQINSNGVRHELLSQLNRDFNSVWRTTVTDAPVAVATAAMRDLDGMTFDTIASSDLVLAVKRDHADVVRMKFASDVGRYVPAIWGTSARISDLKARVKAQASEGEKRFTWLDQLRPIADDGQSIEDVWNDPETQAVLVSRGIAETLGSLRPKADELKVPTAKIIAPPLEGLVVDTTDGFDKIFVVVVRSASLPLQIEVSELDTMMRYFSPVVRVEASNRAILPKSLAVAVREAFSPVVRIDEAGTKSASGLVRASGLVMSKEHPALFKVGDVLQPMIRKNDRNENPIMIGPLDWAYLIVTEVEQRQVKMDFFAGRTGGLSGRSNNRTFRVGLRVKPQGEQTMLRLHAQGKPNEPLIGYEIYDKELDSKEMTFVGRTNWNGQLEVSPIDRPLRLFYVKNGGAVLARLPIVPGHYPTAVADLAGDDLRLQAEAYILGVQNSIIDLVALRELFKARILLRIKQGDMKGADELLEALRNQPSNEELANEMGKRQAAFLKAIGRNAQQARKVDNMFSTTREMLSKHINPKLMNDLEDAFIAAKKGGG